MMEKNTLHLLWVFPLAILGIIIVSTILFVLTGWIFEVAKLFLP